jgi:hypothetical protein
MTDIYVLRIWLESREPPNWRASLSHLNNHEKNYFSSPEEVVEHLRRLIGSTEVSPSTLCPED